MISSDSSPKAAVFPFIRRDCDNLKSLPPQERARFIDVSWDTDNTQDKSFNAELTLIAKDQKSMISSISKICEDLDVNISGLNAKANKDETVVINLNLSIQNKEQMEKIIRSLKNVPGIMEAYQYKIMRAVIQRVAKSRVTVDGADKRRDPARSDDPHWRRGRRYREGRGVHCIEKHQVFGSSKMKMIK